MITIATKNLVLDIFSPNMAIRQQNEQNKQKNNNKRRVPKHRTAHHIHRKTVRHSFGMFCDNKMKIKHNNFDTVEQRSHLRPTKMLCSYEFLGIRHHLFNKKKTNEKRISKYV